MACGQSVLLIFIVVVITSFANARPKNNEDVHIASSY